MKRWEHRFGALGAGYAVAGLVVLVLAPALTYEVAQKLMLPLSVCSGTSLLWVLPPGRMPARQRIVVAIVAGLVTSRVPVDEVMSLRWRVTLRRGAVRFPDGSEGRSDDIRSLIPGTRLHPGILIACFRNE